MTKFTAQETPPALQPNIARLLWDTATARGDAEAIREREYATTYSSLRARAAALGRALQEAKAEPGDRVAIFLERGRDAAAAFFGATAAGCVGINVNETLRPRQVEHILQHSGAKVLISSDELLGRQPRELEAGSTRILLAEEVPEAGELELIERVGTDVAQIIYTSGSTGLPKGVTLSHANVWAGTRAVSHYLGLRGEDRIASLLPFSFDYGFNQLLDAVYLGATLIVERSPLPQRIVETLEAERVTVLPCVPPLWLQLLGVERFRNAPLLALRVMTNTGGRVPTAAVRGLREAQPQAQLYLMYGLTEAFRSTYLPPEEADRRPDSIGRAIPGAEILVLNEELEECEPGEVGELVHRGPTVGLGYWNDPEATARVYRPNPLRPAGTPDTERVVFSGDLVRRDEGGFLYFVGRRDKMIKTLGFRVSPDEVTDVLYASGEVVEAVVTTEPNAQKGDQIVAFVVLANGGSEERLRGYCKAELPRYMQPARIELREALPRTSSGKFDSKELTAT